MHLLGGLAEKLSDVRTNFSLSPDGKQIAFLRSQGEPNASTALVIANLEDTQERELLTRPSDRNFSVNCMAWSPDGSMIAIVAVSDSMKVSREVLIVRIADAHLEQLTTLNGREFQTWFGNATDRDCCSSVRTRVKLFDISGELIIPAEPHTHFHVTRMVTVRP